MAKMRVVASIIFITSLAFLGSLGFAQSAPQGCVRYIEAHSNPLYPPSHGSGAGISCVEDASTARHILQKRLEARCATRPGTQVSVVPVVRLTSTLREVVTAFTLLGLPIVIGFFELGYTIGGSAGGNTGGRTSTPYTAFVVLTCVLHLIVLTALYSGSDGDSAIMNTSDHSRARALFDTECCMQGSRFLLRQPLCGGGALIARVEPPVPPLRYAVVRAIAVFTAAAWVACAVSVLRTHAAAFATAVRSGGESVPLLAPKSNRR